MFKHFRKRKISTTANFDDYLGKIVLLFVGQPPHTKELRNLEQSVDLRQDLRQGQTWMTTNDHITEVKHCQRHNGPEG